MPGEPALLVTGGCGFIGSNLIRRVRRTRPDWRVLNYDALTYAGNPSNLADLADDRQYTFVHGDVRDREALTAAMWGCRFVVHCAAESYVDRSIDDSAPFLTTNVVGTQVLLDACRETPTLERIVQMSTDEVYGSLPLDRPNLVFTESSPLAPNNPYAASKAAADLLALAAHRTFGLPVAITRSSNNFGPYQHPEKVIPLFVTNLLDGRKVPLYGDGRNVRDWVHVEDHCEAVLRVLEAGAPGTVYNVGADNERSNRELTEAILAVCGHDVSMIEAVPDRLGHDRRYGIDATRLKTELGWTPRRSVWPWALAETVEWYRANEAWWGGLVDRERRAAA